MDPGLELTRRHSISAPAQDESMLIHDAKSYIVIMNHVTTSLTYE